MRIPLKHGSQVVAEVKFTGRTPVSAKGQVRAVDGNTDVAKRIRDLVGVSKGMARADVTTPTGPVKYWTGFWGWLGGLSVVVPSIGVSVDWSNVDYP